MGQMVISITFAANTVIRAAHFNTVHITDIRDTYNAHDIATTGVHGLTGGSVVVGTTTSQTLANKTIASPVFSGTVTGTYNLGGTPTLTAPIFSGTITGTYTLGGTPTLTAPTIADLTNMQHDHLDADDGGTLSTSAIASGTFADARIAQSNVTQHQAALTILETQITDGSLLARVGSNETITGAWAAPVTDPPSARQIVSQGLARMWIWLLDTGGSQTDYNVSSSSKTGTGSYIISIDTDLSVVDGVVEAKWSIGKSGTDGVPTVGTSNNASTILVSTYIADLSAATVTLTDGNPYIVLFGNQ